MFNFLKKKEKNTVVKFCDKCGKPKDTLVLVSGDTDLSKPICKFCFGEWLTENFEFHAK